mmetsp:Transcript_5029/g.10979  ORF Transcript_5029/g.10979 Transcript_5029/m.10979 type:complete len:88 (+) Transcript_5029:87-350(+)
MRNWANSSNIPSGDDDDAAFSAASSAIGKAASAWLRLCVEEVPRVDEDDNGASWKRRDWVNRRDGAPNASAGDNGARSVISSKSSGG